MKLLKHYAVFAFAALFCGLTGFAENEQALETGIIVEEPKLITENGVRYVKIQVKGLKVDDQSDREQTGSRLILQQKRHTIDQKVHQFACWRDEQNKDIIAAEAAIGIGIVQDKYYTTIKIIAKAQYLPGASHSNFCRAIITSQQQPPQITVKVPLDDFEKTK